MKFDQASRLAEVVWMARLADMPRGENRAVLQRTYNGEPGCGVDHKDRDSLNNQRSNLRPATDVQNAQNRGIRKHSTPYKGVHFRKSYRKYIAYIQINKKFKYLGVFTDAKEAARTYDREALLHFGEFAVTNKQMGVL